MKRYVKISTFIFLALLFQIQIGYTTDFTLPKVTPVKVYFSPKGGCTEAIIHKIEQARTEVLVQTYSSTSAPIAKALVIAHKRGVKISAILEKSQRSERYTSVTFLKNAGIQTYIDDRHAIVHNKIMSLTGQ